MLSRFRYLPLLTLLLWLSAFGGIITDLALHPHKHNSTAPQRTASIHWWASVDMYSDPAHSGSAYFYLPQSAILYTPFTLGPYLLGEILERTVCFALFGCGVFFLTREFLSPPDTPLLPAALNRQVFLVSLLAIPCSLASLRNGQFDLVLAALILLTVASLTDNCFNLAAFFLSLGLALKPLMLVPLLLFGALYPALRGRLAGGVAIVLLLPFLRLDWRYVIHEHHRFYETLRWAYPLNEKRFSDLGGLLRVFGFYPGLSVLSALRLLAALGSLFLGWMAKERLPVREAAWSIGALGAAYLMLFNPRTEACSFVFVGPFAATFALWLKFQGRPLLRLSAMIGTLGFACDAFPDPIHDHTDIWLKPLLTLLFLVVGITLFCRKNSKPDRMGRLGYLSQPLLRPTPHRG